MRFRWSRKTRGREVQGNFDPSLDEFRDSESISTSSKISRIMCWFDNDCIYGIQAHYALSNNHDVSGPEHLRLSDKDSAKQESLEIDSDDHIVHISGKYKNCIGYLKMMTAKGVIKDFGETDGINTISDFSFGITSKEHPSSIFGALSKKCKQTSSLSQA